MPKKAIITDLAAQNVLRHAGVSKEEIEEFLQEQSTERKAGGTGSAE